MYYYGPNYPYGANTGYGYPTQNNGVGGWFALILVIFILLVIIVDALDLTWAVAEGVNTLYNFSNLTNIL